jgi:NitT/TauT family transport system permease protein
MNRPDLRILAGGAGIAAVAVAWQIASAAVGAYWVPGLGAIGARLWDDLLRGALLRDVAATGQLVLIGTLLGLLVGVAMACALRVSPRMDRMLQPFITAVMGVPKLGLVPLLVLWFGTGWMPKLMLVVLTVLFIVFAVTYSGLVTVDRRLVMTARVLGASPMQVTRHVVLPTIWPFVLTGLEVALPWAVSAALVAEYLSAQVGIGHAIDQARQVRDSVGVFTGILIATAVVLVGNACIAVARNATIKGS